MEFFPFCNFYFKSLNQIITFNSHICLKIILFHLWVVCGVQAGCGLKSYVLLMSLVCLIEQEKCIRAMCSFSLYNHLIPDLYKKHSL